ncbi:MAG: radical SAM protein [Ruminococcaceae bacterium]|nr:radical SAM protein [Oscillospiraceae bacterium]
MPNKAYFEITNACNLSCSFCHGTRRPIRYLTVEEFTRGAVELRGFADYLYYHLMGEPLLHPKLEEFLTIAHSLGFKSVLTTNGTLLGSRGEMLLGAKGLHKVSISLHSFEANGASIDFDAYLSDCFTFAANAAERGIIAVLRLWNRGGEDSMNRQIIKKMHDILDSDGLAEWKETYSGYRIRDRIFLEWGERFDWPDAEGEYRGECHSCYGLRDQVGVLSDGTVVPCCLDADGAIALGNIFTTPLSDILSSHRAQALKKSFQTRCITEELCRRCGYAQMRFSK